jgi:uncharacterized C2H2 Zn-finger protein
MKNIQEEYIPYFEKFLSRLDDKYNFVDFIGDRFNAKTRVVLSCREHGRGDLFGNPWQPVADSIMQGSGCPKCAGKYKFTRKEYTDKVKKLNYQLLNFVGEFKGIQSKVNLECPIHGAGGYFDTPWTPTLSNLLHHNKGCPKCSSVYRRSKAEWIHLVDSMKYSFVKFFNEFKGKNTRIVVNCPVHGQGDEYKTKWIPRLEDILMGSGCPKCSNLYSYSNEEYLAELEESTPYKVVNFVSIGNNNKHSKVNLHCSIHGEGKSFDNPWLPSINNVLRGGGCPKCTNSYIYTESNIIDKINSNAGYEFVKFSTNCQLGVKSKVIVRCDNHNNLPEKEQQWETTVDSLFRGSGCPSCSEYGFNKAKEAYFYLQNLFSDGELIAIKIGITNRNPVIRMNQQSARSLLEHELVDYIYSASGNVIYNFERAIHQYLKSLGSTSFVSKELMPDGYTETINPTYREYVINKMIELNFKVN